MKKITKDKKTNKVKVVTINKEPSMTDQSYKQQCDAKTVVKNYLKTGLVTHIAKTTGQFMDVSEVKDLSESLTKVKQVEYYFSQLPAEMRAHFDNNPMNLLKDMADDGESIQDVIANAGEETGVLTQKEAQQIKEQQPQTKDGKNEKDTGSN